MKPRQVPGALARLFLPLLAAVAAAAASPANAAVTFIQAGADSLTLSGVGEPDTTTFGPSDRSHSLSDPYVASKSYTLENRGLSQVVGSSGGAVQLDGAAKAEFFVRSSLDTNAIPGDFQFATHGVASASAFYDFSVNAESAVSLSFSAFASSTPSADAYVVLDFFDIDTHAYFRQGDVAGMDTLYYTVPVGNYGVALTTFSEGSLPAGIFANSDANGGATANLSLQVTTLLPPPAVPEPATSLLMLLGLGAAGATRRWRPSRERQA